MFPSRRGTWRFFSVTWKGGTIDEFSPPQPLAQDSESQVTEGGRTSDASTDEQQTLVKSFDEVCEMTRNTNSLGADRSDSLSAKGPDLTPVGSVWFEIDKLSLSTEFIGLAIVVAILTAGVLLWRRGWSEKTVFQTR